MVVSAFVALTWVTLRLTKCCTSPDEYELDADDGRQDDDGNTDDVEDNDDDGNIRSFKMTALDRWTN